MVSSKPKNNTPLYNNTSTTSSINTKSKKKKKKDPNSHLKNIPKEYICELSHNLMSDPVRSVYGNVFESNVINTWMKEQGRICPITGKNYYVYIFIII